MHSFIYIYSLSFSLYLISSDILTSFSGSTICVEARLAESSICCRPQTLMVRTMLRKSLPSSVNEYLFSSSTTGLTIRKFCKDVISSLRATEAIHPVFKEGKLVISNFICGTYNSAKSTFRGGNLNMIFISLATIHDHLYSLIAF